MRSVNVTKEDVRLFNMIAIETSAVCNRKCVFCPNATTARPDELMDVKLIIKIIEELRDLRYKGVITLYLYNEPFRDPRLLQIVEYITAVLPQACIGVSTNGDFFKTAADIQAAYDAGVRQLTINVYNAAEGMLNAEAGQQRAARRAVVLQSFLDELKVDQKASLYRYAPPGKRIGRVEHKYGVIEHGRMGSFELQNRSGNIAHLIPALTEPLQKMCVRPFRFMNVNWKGEVVLCCNDYHGDIVFGNVADRSLVNIWNDPRMHSYRVALLKKDRDIGLCRGCDYSGGSYQHMVETITFGSKRKDKEAIDAIRND